MCSFTAPTISRYRSRSGKRRVRDDEPALRQPVAVLGEGHRRLERRHVVVGDVADDRQAEPLGLLERGEP
jgi:hypothetical protein